jgi:hypothetical protein
VVLGVMLARLAGMVGGMRGMAMRGMRMMGRRLVRIGLVMLGGFAMVPGGMLMMLGSGLVVIDDLLLGHDDLLRVNGWRGLCPAIRRDPRLLVLRLGDAVPARSAGRNDGIMFPVGETIVTNAIARPRSRAALACG